MVQASATLRSGFSERAHRLPLAGTRSGAERGAHAFRPRLPTTPANAEAIDREACRLAAREIRCRIVQAHVVAELLKRHLWRPLGFIRLSDYAAERLGVRKRSLEEDARVITALELLPAIRMALETGAIRWTHARLLAGVAAQETERRWLERALLSTTRQLAELVKAARERARAARAGTGPEACASDTDSPNVPPDACATDAGARPDACASRAAGVGGYASPNTHASDAVGARVRPDACAPRHGSDDGQAGADPDACASSDSGANAAPAGPALADDGSDADPLVRWNIQVTRAGRKLWRMTGDIASRLCGTSVPASQVAEAIAAEAMSWHVWEPPTPEPPRPGRPARAGADSAIAAFEALHGTSEGFAWVSAPPALRPLDADLESLRHSLHSADAHEIDRRLRAVRSAAQRIDAQLGACLRQVLDLGVHRHLGFADLRLYGESRLGICGAKALALVRLDRQCALRSPALLRAYRDGRVTWLAATALLDVISPQHEDAWIERARRVTLRRLEADVSWALDRADDGGSRRPQPPPPLDLDVTADALSRIDDADVQMRARPQTDIASFSRHVDARIAAVMPASVATLLEDAIEGCRHAVEPRWRSFERILAHAWLTWTTQPHHENPVFARDSYRCQVPGCRSRGPLHAHHIWFRSKGGPDFAWNLVTVCDAHHQAIHRGEVRVEGHAPDRVSWQLGCRPGKAPLVRLRGDVYVDH